MLIDYILKLKLNLLSLPTNVQPGKANFSFGMHSTASSQCERCRGLGSFLSEMVSYIRKHPFELSALGYFTVSRSTLTTVKKRIMENLFVILLTSHLLNFITALQITGVIVTYLVVLIQFQSYASSSSS